HRLRSRRSASSSPDASPPADFAAGVRFATITTLPCLSIFPPFALAPPPPPWSIRLRRNCHVLRKDVQALNSKFRASGGRNYHLHSDGYDSVGLVTSAPATPYRATPTAHASPPLRLPVSRHRPAPAPQQMRP